MGEGLKVFQCNVQSLHKHKEELQRVLIEEDYSFALISETWTQTDQETTSRYRISTFNGVFDSREDGYGGAAVYLKNTINFTRINLPSLSGSTQAVAVSIPKLDIILVSIYISPSIQINELEDDITSIFNHLKQHKKVILGGDCNAHHVSWGDESCDRKGGTIMDLINSYSFLILNDGSRTFVPIQMNKRSTAIDITICTAELYGLLDWKVLDYGVGSHHMAIETRLGDNTTTQQRWIYNNQQIKNSIANLDVSKVQNWRDLTVQVQKARRASRKRDNFTPKYWWSQEVEEAWKEKREARREFNRIASVENIIKLKKAAAVFQRLKKKSKQAKLEEFVEQINPHTTSQALWKMVGRLTGKKFHKKENNPLQDDEAMAEQFLDLHFGPNEEIEENLLSNSTVEYDILDKEKWYHILSSKKPKSAPGDDKITYEMLRILSPRVTETVIKDLNSQWRRGYPDGELKNIKVVAIPKAGKDQTQLEGKRPISLVPTCTKVINTAVLDVLRDTLEESNLLPERSFGFRKGLSTNTCISYVVNKIKQNKREGLKTAIIFVDLSNAFNTVNVTKLEETMHGKRIQPEVISWITAFLRNRKIIFETNGKKIHRIVSNGLPQGDVLSPTLFNLYTTALHSVEVEGVELVQFADDFGIIVSARTIDGLNENGNLYLREFEEKCQQLELKLNPNKTKTLLFQLGGKKLNYQVNGALIETVDTHRYLGVTLDRSLSFSSHIKELKIRTNERLNMLKVISGTKQGGHPQTLINVHKALIRSTLEYGSTVYYNAAATNKHKLEVLNNHSLRKATGCTKTTPLNTLVAIAGLEPPAIRQEYITGTEIARNIAQQTVVGRQLVETNISNDVEESQLTYMELIFFKHFQLFDCVMPIVKNCSLNLQVSIKDSLDGLTTAKKSTNPVQLKQLALYAMHGTYKNRGRVFTDASKENGSCGVGIYVECIRKRTSLRLSHEVSITGAEIIAIHAAMKIIQLECLENQVIYTDSKSACEILETARKSSTREEILHDILTMAAHWKVSIQWIPSHVNINGNDIADELAKLGTRDESLAVDNPISYKDVYWILKRKKHYKTNEWYSEYAKEKGQKFYKIQDTFSEQPWFIGLDLTSKQIRLLNRMMAGHDWSKYWLAKMKLADNPNCDECNEPENAEHLILRCSKFRAIREKYKFSQHVGNLADILVEKNIITLKEICDFVQQAKLDI